CIAVAARAGAVVVQVDDLPRACRERVRSGAGESAAAARGRLRLGDLDPQIVRLLEEDGDVAGADRARADLVGLGSLRRDDRGGEARVDDRAPALVAQVEDDVRRAVWNTLRGVAGCPDAVVVLVVLVGVEDLRAGVD